MHMMIRGFKPPDAQWKRMKAVYDSCNAAGLSVPREVETFFDDREPDEAGVEVELTKMCRQYEGDGTDVLELEIEKIPKGVRIIKFYGSY